MIKFEDVYGVRSCTIRSKLNKFKMSKMSVGSPCVMRSSCGREARARTEARGSLYAEVPVWDQGWG